jgi:hypothetical protein
MRRIIERVVTVVTTTTWKISWEPDSSPAQPAADPVSHQLPPLESLPASTPPGSTVIETEEVYPHETEEISESITDDLPDDLHSYQSKKGIKEDEYETY